MGAAFGIGVGVGDLIVSIGTSGVVCGISHVATSDDSGFVAGFADATGLYLPLVCTLNAAPVLTSTARMLGVGLETFSEIALSAPSGAGGVVFVPYLDGERTPNLPHASGSLHGLRQSNTTPAHIARAAVEGLLCGLNVGLDALSKVGVDGKRIILVGGGARSQAICEIAANHLRPSGSRSRTRRVRGQRRRSAGCMVVVRRHCTSDDCTDDHKDIRG